MTTIGPPIGAPASSRSSRTAATSWSSSSTEPAAEEVAGSVMFALERGIEAVFQLEDSELDSELLPPEDGPRDRMLFTESAEGGAGVLRRLQAEKDALARAAGRRSGSPTSIRTPAPTTAAETPSTPAARPATTACSATATSWYHELIDRHRARDLLLAIAGGVTLPTRRGQSRTEQSTALIAQADSSLEARFVQWLKDNGYRLPDQAQVTVTGAYARPDFVYQRPNAPVAVFVDGPVHDDQDVAQRDAAAAERLEDLGWYVIRVRHDDDWQRHRGQQPHRVRQRTIGAPDGRRVRTRLAGHRPRPGVGRAAGQRRRTCWCCGRSAARTTRSPPSSPTWSRSTRPGSPAPSPDDLGDARAAGLLRTALRIGFRSSAGPFRSLASIAVEPRPYQLVPLLMAMRQPTVRMAICDDVGIGKTVESGLIAAELLAQGEASGLAVLCSPALAEQWQEELRTKFGIDAELVLASTVPRLERALAYGESLFDKHRIVVVSTDFIKSPRHRDDFVAALPRPGDRGRGAHLRADRRSRRPDGPAALRAAVPARRATRAGTCCWSPPPRIQVRTSPSVA